ncbi:TPA: hypothetical protein DEB00_02940 [Candidatus Uhrbacteria bacterium]|nr:hypothetical protein [Candidatus Uhrbacteria bacterium]
MKRQPLQALRRILQYRFFFIVNIALLLLLALSFGREFVRNTSIQKEIALLEQEKQSLEERNRSLNSYEEYLLTESFLEKEAREKFGLQRPGETQVFIGGELIGGDEGAQQETVIVQEDSRLQQWVWYFFDPEMYGQKKTS